MSESVQSLSLLLFGIVVCAFLVFMSSASSCYQLVSVADGDEQLAKELFPVVKGASILFFPYTMVRKSLLHGDSSLSGASFRPVYSGELTLQVIPLRRVPKMLLRSRGRVLGLDEKGVPFVLKNGLPKQGLRQIELSSLIHLAPGEPLPRSLDEMITGLLLVLDSVREVRFTKIVMEPNQEWRLFTREGVTVRAGPSDGLMNRLKLLPPLLHVIERQKFKSAVLDLRSESMPVLKVIPK